MNFKLKTTILLILFSFCFQIFPETDKTISVAINYHPEIVSWFQEVVLSYEKKFPDRTVNIIPIREKSTESTYQSKVLLMLKCMDNVDVVRGDSFFTKSEAANGLLSPLNVETYKQWNTFYPFLKELVTYDGTVYGLPENSYVRGIFYNREIFKKADIELPWNPKNWEDILQAAKIIRKKLPHIFPIAFNLRNSDLQTLLFFYGTGDNLYQNGKWVITSRGLLDTLNFIFFIYRQYLGLSMDITLSPNCDNIINKELIPESKVAISFGGNWKYNLWKREFPEVAKNIDFIPMPTQFGDPPGHITISGCWVLSINSKSSKKQLAFEFLKYAVSRKSLLSYIKLAPNLVPRKDIADSDLYPDYLKKASKFLQFAKHIPSEIGSQYFYNQLSAAVKSVIIGNSPYEAMSKFADSVESKLGKNNVSRCYRNKDNKSKKTDKSVMESETNTYQKSELNQKSPTPASNKKYNETATVKPDKYLSAITRNGRYYYTNSIGMKFAYVGPGSFEMGSSDGEPDEKPMHKVTISKPFLIGTYEVTQDQYQLIMGINPSETRIGYQRPVTDVSWNDANKFCKKLTNHEHSNGSLNSNYLYRLPTESEWEYAAKGGSDSRNDYKYSGSNVLSDVGWSSDSLDNIHIVGSKKPNSLGIYDMSGNVSEWCSDWYGIYPKGSVVNPQGKYCGIDQRVFRGGSSHDSKFECRNTYRNSLSPERKLDDLGFRVVLSRKK